MHKYPEEVGQYIRDHTVGISTKKLTADLNREFSEKYQIEFTEKKIRSYKKNHKLKSGTKGGNPKGYSQVYPEGMETFIRSIASGRTSEEIAAAVNEKYDHRKESESLQEKSRDHYRSEHTLQERA